MSKLISISSGAKVPVVGLGTSKCDDVYGVVCNAIDVGYRHIDTAYMYENEDEIGRAICDKIKEGVVTRDELWLTSKVWNAYNDKDKVHVSLEKTLTALRVEYLDLYLIHWPIGFKESVQGMAREVVETTDVDYLDTWHAMEKLHEEGKVRNIGVSNFNSEQIERIIKQGKIPPVVNQVEAHVYLSQEKLRTFCVQRGITLTAYSPLGSPGRKSLTAEAPRLMQDPVVQQLAKKYSKTEGQILIRYHVQRGIIVIPKSSSRERLQQNLNVFDFDISNDDMEALMALNRDYRFIAAPNLKEHKYYPFSIPF